MKRTVGNIEYTLIQAMRKTIRLSVTESGNVRVYAPKGMRLKDCDAFVASHQKDIAELYRRIQMRRKAFESGHELKNGTELLILGKPVTLLLEESVRNYTRLSDDTLLIKSPDLSRDSVRALIRHALSQKELQLIQGYIAYYAPKIGVTPGRIAIREQKSRWGSCSSKHNLNFNWKLMLAPPEALEYVVVHELCHMIEFNHSPRFWTLVGAYYPEYESVVKWLKKYGSMLEI